MRFATGVSYPERPATEIIDLRKGRISVMVYGVNEVGEGAIVLVGIDVGVCVGRSVLVEVVVAVNVGVDVGVFVGVDVLVLGWKGVDEGMVAVAVGVLVAVLVGVMVPVAISGVALIVGVRGVPVSVKVTVGVGVVWAPSGASERAINPRQ